jgi:hypothetical protein
LNLNWGNLKFYSGSKRSLTNPNRKFMGRDGDIHGFSACCHTHNTTRKRYGNLASTRETNYWQTLCNSMDNRDQLELC